MIEALLLILELCCVVLLLKSVRHSLNSDDKPNLGLFAYRDSPPAPQPDKREENRRA